MLSVLIPVYNHKVLPFVEQLLEQSVAVPVPVEIIVIDDASQAEYQLRNQRLASMDTVRYEVLKKNIGRSAIRNKLADRATYPYLLFVDCDGYCPDDHFLKRYIDLLPSSDVICGGRVYGPAPTQSDLMLHWKYGSEREVKSAKQRNALPGYSFMTNNFVIAHSTFQKVRFNESLVQYGHEDTLFGLELKSQEIGIHHIDNPLIHIGLEPAGNYLTKAKQAAENLALLVQQGKIGEQVRLVKVHNRLKNGNLLRLTNWIMKLFGIMIRRNLRSKSPSLRLFDWYRLQYFSKSLKHVQQS